MPRILVTGGAGFIGSHVVDAMVSEGFEVRVLDLLHPASHPGRPSYLDDRVEYLWGDLADPDLAAAAVAGVDGVSHQASMVGLGVDFDDVVDYVRHNDLATAVLLQALARRRFDGRLVVASSMVVYGEGRYRCPDHGPVKAEPRALSRLRTGRFDPGCPSCGADLWPEPVSEDHPVAPRNVYASTKLHQEHLGASFGLECGVPVAALRYHNVYGPRMPRDTPYAGVAAIFRSALERGAAPRVFEDGRQLRDFIHVSDVARANVLALTSDRPVDGPFNIATGRPSTVREMAAALARAFGSAGPTPEVTGQFRRGDVRHVFASPARAAERLGFEAGVGLEWGMADFARAELRASLQADFELEGSLAVGGEVDRRAGRFGGHQTAV
jgi:dTDP-L-rhamnose 4-epimerase